MNSRATFLVLTVIALTGCTGTTKATTTKVRPTTATTTTTEPTSKPRPTRTAIQPTTTTLQTTYPVAQFDPRTGLCSGIPKTSGIDGQWLVEDPHSAASALVVSLQAKGDLARSGGQLDVTARVISPERVVSTASGSVHAGGDPLEFGYPVSFANQPAQHLTGVYTIVWTDRAGVFITCTGWQDDPPPITTAPPTTRYAPPATQPPATVLTPDNGFTPQNPDYPADALCNDGTRSYGYQGPAGTQQSCTGHGGVKESYN